MSAIRRYQRMSLSDVALRLGIHPFDLIRVLVSLEGMPDDLRFTEEDAERIRELGGLETWWTDESKAEKVRRSDPMPLRGMSRAICMQLLSHQVLGKSTTRLDNLFRGLEADAQEHAQVVLHTLLRDGYLQSVNTASGLNISVVGRRAEELARIAAGEQYPPSLRNLWEGAAH